MKVTHDRYRWPSAIESGVTTVHPTDLYDIYANRASLRAAHISINEGSKVSRTTGVALLLKGLQVLNEVGYKRSEGAAIASAISVNGVQAGDQDVEKDENPYVGQTDNEG